MFRRHWGTLAQGSYLSSEARFSRAEPRISAISASASGLLAEREPDGKLDVVGGGRAIQEERACVVRGDQKAEVPGLGLAGENLARDAEIGGWCRAPVVGAVARVPGSFGH